MLSAGIFVGPRQLDLVRAFHVVDRAGMPRVEIKGRELSIRVVPTFGRARCALLQGLHDEVVVRFPRQRDGRGDEPEPEQRLDGA